MSRRARHARRLSTRLTKAARVPVTLRWDRGLRRYRVQWTGGPAVSRMRELAERHAGEVPDLGMTDLVWTRTERHDAEGW